VNFTGADTVQGSFASDEWQIYSCSDFAKSAFAWNIGIGPQEGLPTTVGGKLVNFLLSVPTGTFHGADTYTDVMPAASPPKATISPLWLDHDHQRRWIR